MFQIRIKYGSGFSKMKDSSINYKFILQVLIVMGCLGLLTSTVRFSFTIIICWWKDLQILKGNGGIDPEANETLFLLCNDDLLPLMDLHPLSKLMDRSRTEGENLSTLQWWSVPTTWAESFKEIDGQVENRRRNCLYFAMMIHCRWWISVLQGHLGTGREPKEKLFVLCDDDPLLQTDVRPSNKFMDRWRTERENVCTFGWWSVSVIRCHCEYAIQHASREYVQKIPLKSNE